MDFAIFLETIDNIAYLHIAFDTQQLCSLPERTSSWLARFAYHYAIFLAIDPNEQHICILKQHEVMRINGRIV